MLCLGSPDMLSGYDLSQLCMREVGLTGPPQVSGCERLGVPPHLTTSSENAVLSCPVCHPSPC